jgi:hypothetical protein
MDGIGLVGRISGVAKNTSRVILLTDASSRIPVTIQPSGQRAIVAGDNSAAPPINFIESPDLVRPGDRVVSSGDGGVFPASLVIGQVAADPSGRLRVRLAADYERLKFLRVLRSHPTEPVTDTANILTNNIGTSEPTSGEEAPASECTPDIADLDYAWLVHRAGIGDLVHSPTPPQRNVTPLGRARSNFRFCPCMVAPQACIRPNRIAGDDVIAIGPFTATPPRPMGVLGSSLL